MAMPESEHFILHELATGVFAAIATQEGAAYSNAGIVDLGERTLIFDCFETIAAAQDLKQAAKKITGRSASYLVHSHAHGDHWFGNQVFSKEAVIISTAVAREAMLPWYEDAQECRQNPEAFDPLIKEYKEKAAAEAQDEARDDWLRLAKRMLRAKEQAAILRPKLPEQLFETQLSFHGTRRQAHLRSFGQAHSEGDAALFLPEDHVAFLGDLAFFDRHPYLLYAVPENWIAALIELEAMENVTLVPGHGPLGDRHALHQLRLYLEQLLRWTAEALASSTRLEDLLQAPMPRQLDLGPGSASRIERSLTFLYERHKMLEEAQT